MRKYIYKKKEKFDGTFEIQRWITKGKYYIFDCVIQETNKDFIDWNEKPEIIYFSENDKLQYNQKQRELRQKEYELQTDSISFKILELFGTEKDEAIQNYIKAKNEIRNNLKYLE